LADSTPTVPRAGFVAGMAVGLGRGAAVGSSGLATGIGSVVGAGARVATVIEVPAWTVTRPPVGGVSTPDGDLGAQAASSINKQRMQPGNSDFRTSGKSSQEMAT
jgi:hypothetical protein